ncbi:MAG: response regulator [Candidatus Falkowbacteria bacterium]
MDKKRHILIVEDEAAMLAALTDKFEAAGYEVSQACDGEEGYKAAMEKKPDIILLDVIMPKMDGISLLKKIRGEVKWGGSVPIIMLTNLSDPANVSEAARYQVYDFLVKTDWRLDDVVKLADEKIILDKND